MYTNNSELSDLLDLLDADNDWTVEDGLLVCRHDYTIEPDGECPEGCVSPLLEHGLI